MRVSEGKLQHFFHGRSDLRVDSRRIFKLQINEPVPLTAQQPGEGGCSDPHLPEKEPR